MKVQGTFRARAVTFCARENQTGYSQSVNCIQWGDGRRFRESLEGEHSRCPARTRYKIGKVREMSSNGVMDEGPGKIQEASAHVVSFIVMDIAVVESHVAAVDVKTPALQNKEGQGHGKVIQRG